MIFPFSDNVPSRRKPFVTYVLILANLLALGWMLGQSGQDRAVMTHHRGFIPARVGRLLQGQELVVTHLGHVLNELFLLVGERVAAQLLDM